MSVPNRRISLIEEVLLIVTLHNRLTNADFTPFFSNSTPPIDTPFLYFYHNAFLWASHSDMTQSSSSSWGWAKNNGHKWARQAKHPQMFMMYHYTPNTPHHRHCPLFLVKLLPLRAQYPPHPLDLTRIPSLIRGLGRPCQTVEVEVVPWWRGH